MHWRLDSARPPTHHPSLLARERQHAIGRDMVATASLAMLIFELAFARGRGRRSPRDGAHRSAPSRRTWRRALATVVEHDVHAQRRQLFIGDSAAALTSALRSRTADRAERTTVKGDRVRSQMFALVVVLFDGGGWQARDADA